MKREYYYCDICGRPIDDSARRNETTGWGWLKIGWYLKQGTAANHDSDAYREICIDCVQAIKKKIGDLRMEYDGGDVELKE